MHVPDRAGVRHFPILNTYFTGDFSCAYRRVFQHRLMKPGQKRRISLQNAVQAGTA
jgi:hypothetical protein